MLNILVGIMLSSFWFSLIGLGSTLFLLRLYRVLKDKQTLKQSLFILLIPCSIGYYLTYQEKSRFKFWYEVIVIMAFFFMLIGTVMVIYAHYM